MGHFVFPNPMSMAETNCQIVGCSTSQPLISEHNIDVTLDHSRTSRREFDSLEPTAAACWNGKKAPKADN